MQRRKVGEIGLSAVEVSNGAITRSLESVKLPDKKELLEEKFAKIFVETFNQRRLLAPNIEITNLNQNQMDALDFSITSSIADNLELAEITPLDQQFGRDALSTGKLSVYEFSKWIWRGIIEKKALKYKKLGRNLDRTILLLYPTHWQFFPSLKLIDCLRSTLAKQGCQFSGVFLMWGNAGDCVLLETIYPHYGKIAKPRSYLNAYYVNQEPGSQSPEISVIPISSDNAKKGDYSESNGKITYLGGQVVFVSS